MYSGHGSDQSFGRTNDSLYKPAYRSIDQSSERPQRIPRRSFIGRRQTADSCLHQLTHATPTQLIYALSSTDDIHQHLHDTFTGLYQQQLDIAAQQSQNSSHDPSHDPSTMEELIDECTIRCAFIFVLGYPPSHLEIQRLCDAFRSINHATSHQSLQNDASNSDSLTMSRSQFVEYFTSQIKQQSPHSHIQSVYQAFDPYNQGFIRRSEFYDIMQSLNPSTDQSSSDPTDQALHFSESMKSLFDLADLNHDDIISYREFEAVMSGRIINQY